MPRARWDALVRGQDCPLCEAIGSDVEADEHATTIADLPSGRLRLARNQFVRGYCVFICKTHVREPYELSDEESALFFGDLMRIGRALERVLRPTKMNLELLGNAVPHLHCHLVPRYYGDPAPGRPIDPHQQLVELSDDESAGLAAAIRGELARER